MHSGADVEALTAALNRDIEGDTSTSQPSDSENGVYLTGTDLIPISIPFVIYWFVSPFARITNW